MLFFENKLSDTLKIIQLLLNSQCKLTKFLGNAALRFAVISGSEILLNLLINNGIDLNYRDENGDTALIYAIVYHASPKIVKMLIENDADPSIKNNRGMELCFYTNVPFLNIRLNIIHTVYAWELRMSLSMCRKYGVSIRV